MADWYVYQPDGAHLGPFSTESIAHAILAGRLPEGVHLGAPGGARWVSALDIPVIARALSGAPTPRRVVFTEQDAAALASTVSAEASGAGGMRVLVANQDSGAVDYASTVMMVHDDELELVPSVAPATPGASSMPPPRNSRTLRIDRAAFGLPLAKTPTPSPPTLASDGVPEAEPTSPALFESPEAPAAPADRPDAPAKERRHVDMHNTCFFPDGVPSSVDVTGKK